MQSSSSGKMPKTCWNTLREVSLTSTFRRSRTVSHPLWKKPSLTTSNPGRRLLRVGYIEVVGAVMWLGESFWRLSGASREAVEDAQWLRVTSPASSALRIQAAERCFTSQDGPSGELQRRLRSLLFPRRLEIATKRSSRAGWSNVW